MLAYKQSGQGAPVVVLLHGLFGSARNLATLAKQLAKSCTVYAIDLPNHGDSPHVDNMTIPAMAVQVADTLDALGVARCCLLGHSLGGKVAMSIALQDAARVSKLLVADIAPVEYPDHHSEILDALQALDLPALASRSDADRQLSNGISDAGTRQFLLQNLRKQGDRYVWKLNLPVIARSYGSLRAAVTLAGGEVPFAGPVLFVAGENSGYIRPQNLPAMRALFPRCELQQIAGAGHWLHAEKPAEFAAIVEKFFVNE